MSNIPQPSDDLPIMDNVPYAGVSDNYSRADHVHPKDVSKADLISPEFIGTPRAPTAAVGTESTQLATTQFVKNAIDEINYSGLQPKLTAGRNIEITSSNVINGVDLAPIWAAITERGNTRLVEVTQAQYNALSSADKMREDTLYLITNTETLPYHTNFVIVTQTQYDALPSTKNADGIIRFISDEGYIMLNGVTYGEGGGGISEIVGEE